MNRILAALILALSTVFVSCEPETMLTVDQTSLSYTDAGGSQSITITANKVWSASSNQSWCKVSPSGGEEASSSRITISCDPNTTYDARNATITFTCAEMTRQVSITQAMNNGLLVSRTSYELTKAAQQLNIEVKANVKFSVEVDSGCKDWVKYNSTKGLSTSTVVLDIAENKSYDVREGTITILSSEGGLSQTIVVRQDKTNYLSIEKSSNFFEIDGKEQLVSINVEANVDFTVEVEVDYTWASLIEVKGLKQSVIVVSVQANDNPSGDRVAIVIVREKDGELVDVTNIIQRTLVPEGAVNLGLSGLVFWGECNIGASSPEEYGNYYAWGEVETKNEYSLDTYKWFGNDWYVTKYNVTAENYGILDNKKVLDDSDDVVKVIKGGRWRMPTEKEMKDLENNCNLEYTYVNGVYGALFTSKANGNSIFLPAAGYMKENHLEGEGEIATGWTSSVTTFTPYVAHCLRLNFIDRNYGLPVRPVFSW